MNHLNHAIEEFAKTANNQENKGITKYGKPLNPYDNYDWLDMEFEELVDAAKYNRAEKRKRDFAIGRIREIIIKECEFDTQVQINNWLDFVQGK